MPAISLSSHRAPTHTVPVLRKAFQVFEAVAQNPDGATTKHLASGLRIAPSTCYRILSTFVAAGWLRSRAGGLFELSFGLMPLLRPLLRHEVLVETVREPLAQLARKTGLTAKLTIRQGDDAITIFSAQSPRPHAIASRVGAVVSLAIGSSGAAHLGALPDSEVKRILDAAPTEAWKFQNRTHVLRRLREGRKPGCYADIGSYQPNIHTLSAPIYEQGSNFVGAITILGFPQDFAGAAKTTLMRELKQTASDCTQRLQRSHQGPDSAIGKTGATPKRR
jgi:DNA-binding IclR family transcriptional regulator